MSRNSLNFPAAKILGVWVDEVNEDSALKQITTLLASAKPSYAVTINPEFILTAHKDEAFKEILNNADLRLPDGLGVVFASRWNRHLGRSTCSFDQTVPGITMLYRLVGYAAKKNLPVYFLGGRNGASQKTAEFFLKQYPDLSIAGHFEGNADLSSDEETRQVLKKAAKKMGREIAILFVAYGHPKQEKWIVRNLDRIPVHFAMGVGGSFDVISRQKKAVPTVWKRLGLDWLWRLLIEPTRLPRTMRAVFLFPIRVLLSSE